MKRLGTCVVAVGMLMLSGTVAAEESEARKTLESYADLTVGGVWKSTDDEGNAVEHSYKWILKNEFLQLTAEGGTAPWLGLLGIDPETGKVTWWVFVGNGNVSKSVMTKTDEGVWMVKGRIKGAEMDISVTNRLSKVNENEIRLDPIELIVDDEKQPLGKPQTWKRHKK